jgi:Uma2 family endonuclease
MAGSYDGKTMSTAPRYQPHYTVDDYRHWEGRWELWEGAAVAMSPSPGGRHAELTGRMIMALGRAIEERPCKATVLVEIDWIVAHDTVVRPDITVVCGPAPEGHVEQTPGLVVEVLSPATRTRDLVFKRQLYEEQGVPWYLIVDPDEHTIHVLSRRHGGNYDGPPLAADSGPVTITLCDDCDIVIDPARILR